MQLQPTRRHLLGLTTIAAACLLAACNGSDDSSAPAASAPPSSPSSPSTPATPAAAAFAAGNLVVARTVYDPALVVSGALPFDATPEASNPPVSTVNAVTPGTFPNVFTNDSNDADFGVTTSMYLDQWVPAAASPAQTTNVTAAAAALPAPENFSVSFASQSGMGLNVSQDGKSLVFMGYNAATDRLDVSNSNTPGVVDPSNNDIQAATYRSVGQLAFATGQLAFTHTNAYSGDDARAAVLANGMYYMVGAAGNSGSSPNPTYGALDTLSMDTGLQSIVPGSACAFTQVIGAFQTGNGSSYAPAAAGSCALGTLTDALASQTYAKKTSMGGNQFGFTLASLSGQSFDKTSKDDNLRGLFVDANGTMYVSKDSGSNGVDTVYQVGAAGALAGGNTLAQNTAITIAPGFPTSTLSAAQGESSFPNPWPLANGVGFPSGIWVPSNNTGLMFVADEGDYDDSGTQSYAALGSGGLWVYRNQGGTWSPIAHLTAGLNLGTPYTVTDTAGTYGTPGASYTTAPDGLRHVTGRINADGSYTLYATTSTIGNSLGKAFDPGADSNQLVAVTVSVNGSTVTATGGGFAVMQTAPFGQLLRGVAVVPGAAS
ncbi:MULTISPECIES: hypothetical protein [unclassified Burkholderia]|uniref:hypothetical protein n=1 Tax=unclassified Burkholderia TaxID=2613784 RepID=UPI0014243602|nr:MULTISPECIES: hypothetical protein [unclassified Burkholderia]NIE86548.1 hypothetical protein [Burkholderia sp. Tr-860]NIF65118.1 hypothetical protein [Burkholderia sp. Cy-647]NIF95957.1 hypothetical protein [Burkholderia sp. Ax-1720]